MTKEQLLQVLREVRKGYTYYHDNEAPFAQLLESLIWEVENIESI